MTGEPIRLSGLREDIPARVLAGEGLVGLIRDQLRAEVRPVWSRGCLTLVGSFSVSELEQFLLWRYAPSPILSPWLSGSGFFGRTGSELLERCEAAPARRFSTLASAIREARHLLSARGLDRPPTGAAKRRLLAELGEVWSGRRWLEAAYEGTGSDRRPHPLVGTGGNDGRLDYSQAFLRSLDGLFDLSSARGEPARRALLRLRGFLFAEAFPRGAERLPTGCLDPSQAGGPSSADGATGPARGSSWSLILTLEGLIASRAPFRIRPPKPFASESPLPGGLFGIGGIEARVRAPRGWEPSAPAPRSDPHSTVRALLTPLETWLEDLERSGPLHPGLRRASEGVGAAMRSALGHGSPARLRSVLEAVGAFALLAVAAPRRRPPLPELPPALVRRAHDGSLELRAAVALAQMRPRPGATPLELDWRHCRGGVGDVWGVLQRRARRPGHAPTGLEPGAHGPRLAESVRHGVDPLAVARLLPPLLRVAWAPSGAQTVPEAPSPFLERARARLTTQPGLPAETLVEAPSSDPRERRLQAARLALAVLLLGDAPASQLESRSAGSREPDLEP